MTARSPLLTTDFDGLPVRSIDTLLFRGVGDERRRERVDGLAALVDRADIASVDRYYACLLLTAWGEERGYLAVQQAARQHRSAPWYGCSSDRLWPVDDTFGQLAGVVESSQNLAVANGVESHRRSAARRLISLADAEFMAKNLDFLVSSLPTEQVLDDVVEVTGRGVSALRSGSDMSFPLGPQLIDAAAGIAEDAPGVAVDLTMSILEVDESHRATRYALAVVARAQDADTGSLDGLLRRRGDAEVVATLDRIRRGHAGTSP